MAAQKETLLYTVQFRIIKWNYEVVFEGKLFK